MRWNSKSKESNEIFKKFCNPNQVVSNSFFMLAGLIVFPPFFLRWVCSINTMKTVMSSCLWFVFVKSGEKWRGRIQLPFSWYLQSSFSWQGTVLLRIGLNPMLIKMSFSTWFHASSPTLHVVTSKLAASLNIAWSRLKLLYFGTRVHKTPTFTARGGVKRNWPTMWWSTVSAWATASHT